ncbi:MAG: helix-turn-helix transcriptional regulator [Lachnospiraceae bacterium]|nr:helix-turn-helix transcriptional regulator [Lachnospiraceae bacterium]
MKDKNPIFRSLAMIEEKIQEKLTVEMLAEDIHFSKYHYQRIFRETVGETVMGYVTRRRLFLAAEDLAGTGDSVLAIALKYGYDSHEGFTRSFKTYLGITPTEYRKYHSDIGFPGAKKEESAMMNSKSTDEMIRELNNLIVQAKETAADTRKQKGVTGDSAAIYAQAWEFASKRAEKMAEELKEVLECVTSLTQGTDEISARFLIVKAVEDAAFEASVTAFQVGLMIARAMPEHRSEFRPLYEKYDRLAQTARIRSGKIVDFLNELSAAIFHDMRENATKKIQDAMKAGIEAVEKLSDPSLPYGYIADGVREITEELDTLPLEEVTVYFLEDIVFRMETILFAADMDILRAPQHKQLFDGISNFKEKLDEAAEFFRNLSGEAPGTIVGMKKGSEIKRTAEKMYSDLAVQEGILLFYLKGEIQKLGNAHLDEGQKAALNAVCNKMDRAVRLARNATDERDGCEIKELLHEAYEEMMGEAEKLDVYGGAIRYLAEEMKNIICCFLQL